MSNHLITLWKAHETRILLVLAIILTSLISFQWGQNQQKSKRNTEIKVNINQVTPSQLRKNGSSEAQPAEQGSAGIDKHETHQDKPLCALVASKSSTKYHLPSCRYASKINDGNRRCFSTAAEAQAAGYQAAKCCHK